MFSFRPRFQALKPGTFNTGFNLHHPTSSPTKLRPAGAAGVAGGWGSGEVAGDLLLLPLLALFQDERWLPRPPDPEGPVAAAAASAASSTAAASAASGFAAATSAAAVAVAAASAVDAAAASPPSGSTPS